jgi:hypothetical protein
VFLEGLEEIGKEWDHTACFMNGGMHMAGYSDGTFVLNKHLLHLEEHINSMG